MGDTGNNALVTIDGTDMEIYEPEPFDPKWWSHKFNGPGVRYEVCVCIHTGWIVWINGPFPCGSWPDLRIARDELIYWVPYGEYIIGDGGYRDNRNYFWTPTGLNRLEDRMQSIARARHETVNARLKKFNCLVHVYRHRRTKHGQLFTAVANIVQMEIETDAPLFHVEYSEEDND